MSLRVRFRFDGRCSTHQRYNPQRDGRPQNRECPGCESLYVIHLYCEIALKKAIAGEGIVVANPQALAQSTESNTECEDQSTANEDASD